MKIETTSIRKVTSYARYMRRSRRMVQMMAKSLMEFGWQQPLVVDKDYVIISGYTRLLAARRLKLKTVPVVVAESLTPQQITIYRSAERTANKTDLNGGWFDGVEDELKAIGDHIAARGKRKRCKPGRSV